MSSPSRPQLPTMMHAPTMLRTFHYGAKPDSCAYLQPAYQSSLPQQILNPFLQPTPRIAGAPSLNYELLFHESGGAFEPVGDPYSDKTSQMSNLAVEKPPGDGYNWRKYGQKQVKGGEFPHSYYKCTAAKCDVKKQVERSFDGNIKEIIYKGEHNHQPSQNRRGEEGGYDDDDTESKFENSSVSNDEDEDGTAINEGDSKSSPKINRDTESVESTSQRMLVLQTISETDLLDDGHKWRKYGQKYVKGNNHPRSYYKCTNVGCNVRKRVERSKKDPKAALTTYEDKHNHDVPKARSTSHNTVSAEPASDN
ncbi:probable WRKY transcription factor 58 isoform X2 [Ananas comosus]|uniref:Probable WRKY transcription factor 58 isoform X2 n=1 Tax=Ananas comosus TaxID=4615 RepID=A0A6P5FTL4_ANACO|nr:probable WRKY transcription factor 58 isoform X2 [Ananas comosus]